MEYKTESNKCVNKTNNKFIPEGKEVGEKMKRVKGVNQIHDYGRRLGFEW